MQLVVVRLHLRLHLHLSTAPCSVLIPLPAYCVLIHQIQLAALPVTGRPLILLCPNASHTLLHIVLEV